jgi:hypothetical protein
MHRDTYDIEVRTLLYLTDTNTQMKNRDDFETVCEARSWMKEITPHLVELTEYGFFDGFTTMFTVQRKEK